MITIADNLAEAETRLAAAKSAYDQAMLAVSSRFDEGGAATAIQRQELPAIEKAVERARIEVNHFKKAAAGIPSRAPILLGTCLR